MIVLLSIFLTATYFGTGMKIGTAEL